MRLLLLLLLPVIIVSCKERIELDLQNNSDKLLIEGEINDGVAPYYVKISKSVSFYNTASSVPYDADYVMINDKNGVIDTLTKIATGIYQTNTIVGTIGNTYYLKVLDKGASYLAQSTLNPVPTIDSIYAWYFFKPEDKIVSIKIKDPVIETNYYRFFIKINGKNPEKMYVFDDKLINGTNWSLTANGENVKKGDSIEFHLFGTDQANFDYFKVLIQNQQVEANGNPSAAPTNPQSNISGGVLGYFSANSKRSINFVID